MRYTHEEHRRLVEDYCQRTGASYDSASMGFSMGMLVEKHGSTGPSYLVENPDLRDEDGQKRKIRKKNTHLTPKKKKRKK